MIYTLSPLTTLRTQTPTTNHCILSNIPSAGGAWGGRSSLWYLGCLFCACSALSLSNSFPSAFQSTPFCLLKDALLHCKRVSFDVQKGMFYNAKGHLLQATL